MASFLRTARQHRRRIWSLRILLSYFIHRKIPGKGTNNLQSADSLKPLQSGRDASIKPGWIIRGVGVEELKPAVDAELIGSNRLPK